MAAIRSPRLTGRPIRRGPTAAVTPEEAMPEPAMVESGGVRWVHIPKPRHYAQDSDAIEAFKKSSPPAWRRSERRGRAANE